MVRSVTRAKARETATVGARHWGSFCRITKGSVSSVELTDVHEAHAEETRHEYNFDGINDRLSKQRQNKQYRSSTITLGWAH